MKNLELILQRIIHCYLTSENEGGSDHSAGQDFWEKWLKTVVSLESDWKGNWLLQLEKLLKTVGFGFESETVGWLVGFESETVGFGKFWKWLKGKLDVATSFQKKWLNGCFWYVWKVIEREIGCCN